MREVMCHVVTTEWMLLQFGLALFWIAFCHMITVSPTAKQVGVGTVKWCGCTSYACVGEMLLNEAEKINGLKSPCHFVCLLVVVVNKTFGNNSIYPHYSIPLDKSKTVSKWRESEEMTNNCSSPVDFELLLWMLELKSKYVISGDSLVYSSLIYLSYVSTYVEYKVLQAWFANVEKL